MPLSHEEFPALELFLGAYLHQDWQDDYPSTELAFRDYLASEPRLAHDIPTELRTVLDSHEEERALLDLIAESGSFYLPDAYGLTARAWLGDLLALCTKS